MFQSIGYIYNNKLTLFPLDCLHTKQHLGMKRGICSKKKEPFVPLLSEFTQERATPSVELNPYNHFALEENWCPKNMATNTPVMEVHGVFWFLYINTMFLSVSPPNILACELFMSLSFRLYISFQSSSHLKLHFISTPFKNFVFKVLGLRLIS